MSVIIQGIVFKGLLAAVAPGTGMPGTAGSLIATGTGLPTRTTNWAVALLLCLPAQQVNNRMVKLAEQRRILSPLWAKITIKNRGW
jgi:hypothetical protein